MRRILSSSIFFNIMENKTIAAIATALSNSGISIIRISGDNAISITEKIFVSPSLKKLSEYESNTINYGHIVDNGEVIDEVMVSVMRAPASYTREDVVEINTHGGVLITKKVLSLLLKNGAVIAEPGEFTKRAFLNGRIDLSRAEAIMDIISAENDIALKSGIKQLRGDIYNSIKKIREELIYNIAFIESALDDPEHISLDGYYNELSDKVDSVLNELSILSKSAENGRIVRDGINTVILGKPNAGKSSLMNSLMGEERAIVTDIAGTTRDSLEESIRIGSVSFRISDTAGIRDTDDTVEKIGVERSRNLAKDAELILYVVDSSNNLDENDFDIIKMTVGKRIVVLLNKNDLDQVISVNELEDIMCREGHNKSDFRVISISARDNIGVDVLCDEVQNMFFNGDIGNSNEIMITNIRHKEAIDEAINSLNMVKSSIYDNMPEDFLTIDMMNAYSSLGYIIGEEVDDDLVNEIFSRFCMGK